MNTLYSCLYVIGCIIIIMCWTVARGMKVRCVRNFRWISRGITLILTYFYRFQFLTVSILFDSRRISFRNWQPQLKWTTIKIFLRHQRNVRDMLSRRYGLAHKPVVGGSASSCYDCQGLVTRNVLFNQSIGSSPAWNLRFICHYGATLGKTVTET